MDGGRSKIGSVERYLGLAAEAHEVATSTAISPEYQQAYLTMERHWLELADALLHPRGTVH